MNLTGYSKAVERERARRPRDVKPWLLKISGLTPVVCLVGYPIARTLGLLAYCGIERERNTILALLIVMAMLSWMIWDSILLNRQQRISARHEARVKTLGEYVSDVWELPELTADDPACRLSTIGVNGKDGAYRIMWKQDGRRRTGILFISGLNAVIRDDETNVLPVINQNATPWRSTGQAGEDSQMGG